MSGSGHHFGHKITEEVFSALRKLFWKVEQHSVDVAVPCAMTVYITDIPSEAIEIPIQASFPKTFDPLSGAQTQPAIHSVAMIYEVALGEGGHIELNPALCHEPVFSEISFISHGVSFENMAIRKSIKHPITPFSTSVSQQPAEAKLVTRSKGLEAGTFKTTTRKHPSIIFSTRPQQASRFYTMPIKKAPIPPHRFSSQVREIFREALAEKANTRQANIQLRIVFERMDMSLYSSMTQDDSGNLMCTPKAEIVGKNAAMTARQNQNRPVNPPSYLVFGTRLDTREDIRALIPASALEEALS